MAFARLTACLLALCAFAAVPASAAADSDGLVAVPPLVGRVVDLTHTLTPWQLRDLEATIDELEQRKGSQIGVLLVPSTKPEEIEQYSIRVVEQWKLGRKGIDDGVLLLVAKNDHRLRIEVGRGLEGAIPDIVASQIIREYIAPEFLTGDFYVGIASGVDRLISLIDGEHLPSPAYKAVKGFRKKILPHLGVIFGAVGFGMMLFIVWLLQQILPHTGRSTGGGRSFWDSNSFRPGSGSDSSGGGSSDSGSGGGSGGGGGDFGGGGASGSW
jgi:uncharacterized protein